jgi:predicted nucleic acid-binding protein
MCAAAMTLTIIFAGCVTMNEAQLAKITNASRLYADSNVFIYLLEASPDFFVLAKRLFDHIDTVGARLLTNELTLAECIYKPSREDDGVLVSRYEAFLEPGDEIEIIGLDGALATRAAKAGGKLGLKLADAVHYLSAYESGCQFFVTADTRVRSSPELEVLNIQTP